MSNRRVKAVIQPPTREDMETIVREIAELKNQKTGFANKMNKLLVGIKTRYEDRMKGVQKLITEKLKLAYVWAKANEQEFSGEKRSIKFLSGRAGFRLGQLKVQGISKEWTFAKILETVQADENMKALYVRMVPELDREQLIEDYKLDLITKEQLAKIGVEIVQDDTFYVEPDLEPEAEDKLSITQCLVA